MNTADPVQLEAAKGRWWRAALALIVVVTVVRVAMVAVLPYELAADEAQYWDWSRHFSLAYHTKGPAIAWSIAATTALAGVSEFGVRLGAPLYAGAFVLALAALARRIGGGEAGGKAALWAVLLALSIPAYHATALLMTIDGPMLACWALAGLGAYRLHAGAVGDAAGGAVDGERGVWRWGLLFGAALGVGVLFKATILLGGVGMLAFLWLLRSERKHSVLPGVIAAGVVMAVAVSPMIVWNAQHDWGSVRHLLGHVGLSGSDLPGGAAKARGYRLSWTLGYLGALVALAGPVVVVLGVAARGALRRKANDAAERAGAVLGVCAALPVLLTYLVVSLFTDVEGNWAIGAWVALIPVGGVVAGRAMDEHAARVRGWLALPAGERRREGILRRRPESVVQVALHWALGYGLVAAAGMCLLGPLSRLPMVGAFVPIERVSGARALAAEVERVRGALGDGAFVVGSKYATTALLAFYLPGRPTVYCAGSGLGDRRSAYDTLLATDLGVAGLLGRDAVLVDHAGRTPVGERWGGALRFESVEEAAKLGRVAVSVGRGYGGAVKGGGAR